MAQEIEFNLNGEQITCAVEPPTLLVDLLRDRFGLAGIHVACETSRCGSCVIHIDGRSVKSCIILAVEVDGCSVMTIEGLADGERLHPLQTAFGDCGGRQCGFCTPGMVMSALDLLQHNRDPDESEIREWMEGNICHCMGYHNIVGAVQAAASELQADTEV